MQGTPTVSATTAANILDAPASPVAGPTKTGTPPPVAGASNTQTAPAAKTDPGAKPAEAAAPAATDGPISPKLQLLIQRDKAVVERERAVAAREAEVSKYKDFDSYKSTPLKALELLGLTYDDIVRAQMNEGVIAPETEIKKVHERLTAFEKSQEDGKRQEEEDERQELERKAQATISNFKSEISKYLKDNSERYELIAYEGQEDLVYDVVDEHYNRTLKAAQDKATEAGEDPTACRGEVMTTAQAADKVELYLEQKYNKARDLKKVQVLMGPRPPTPPKTPKVDKPQSLPRQTPPTPTTTTLTNNNSANPSTPRPNRILTDQERAAKAVAYAKGIRL